MASIETNVRNLLAIFSKVARELKPAELYLSVRVEQGSNPVHVKISWHIDEGDDKKKLLKTTEYFVQNKCTFRLFGRSIVQEIHWLTGGNAGE